jgi:hypothetical protein
MNAVIIVIVILVVLFAISACYKKEGFTADGLVFNIPSEWFRKPKYDVRQWFVEYHPDQLSQPECLSYNRGDPAELNYLSSAYRFWRQ